MDFVRVFPDPEAMASEIARQWHNGAQEASQKKMCLRLFCLEGQRLHKFIERLAHPNGITKCRGK